MGLVASILFILFAHRVAAILIAFGHERVVAINLTEKAGALGSFRFGRGRIRSILHIKNVLRLLVCTSEQG